MRKEESRRGKESNMEEYCYRDDDKRADVQGHKFTWKDSRSQKRSLADDKRNLTD